MDFLKKHYEKILLSVVLLGLVGALVVMSLIIPSEQEKVREMGEAIIAGHVAPLPNLDLTNQSNVTVRLQSRYQLDFDTTNKLFNPVDWVRTPDGRVIKATGIGPQKAVVTGITPLYMAMTLDSIGTNEFGARYVISVEHQAAASPYLRRKQKVFVSMDDRKKDFFTLENVVGPADNPDYLVLRLADTGQEIQLSKTRPFLRVDDYQADLKYEPDHASWSAQRVGSRLSFGGVIYTIVDINSNEVVLSAQSNQKKWTLRYTP